MISNVMCVAASSLSVSRCNAMVGRYRCELLHQLCHWMLSHIIGHLLFCLLFQSPMLVGTQVRHEDTFWLFQHLKITAHIKMPMLKKITINYKIGSGDSFNEEVIKHGLYELMDL